MASYCVTNVQLMLVPEHGDVVANTVEAYALYEQVRDVVMQVDASVANTDVSYDWNPGDDFATVYLPCLELLKMADVLRKLHEAGIESYVYAR